MTARTRMVVRNVLMAAIGLGSAPIHEAHPEWTFISLPVVVALMATIYGVNLWLWARENSG